MAQELLKGSVEPVEGITSYSWRRVAPSLEVILGWDEATLLPRRDWQDKGQMRSSTTAMPLHAAPLRSHEICFVSQDQTLGLGSGQIFL